MFEQFKIIRTFFCHKKEDIRQLDYYNNSKINIKENNKNKFQEIKKLHKEKIEESTLTLLNQIDYFTYQ